MTLINCYECNKEISDKAKSCPHCGCPAKEEVEKIMDELQRRLEEAKGKTFTFLLIGRVGVGKSSTINSLMDAKVSPVGDFDPTTMNVTVYETNLHGAIVRVIDTPGLCDAEESVGNDAKYIELIRRKIPYAIDAVLFVSRLDESRVDSSEKRGLRLITSAFGAVLWKKAVIVFTRSGNISSSRFEEYLTERTKRIRAELLALQLSSDIVNDIPAVAADNMSPEKVNSDGQKWIPQLYLAVFNRVEESSRDVLFLATRPNLEKMDFNPKQKDTFTEIMVPLSGAVVGGQVALMAGSAAGLGSIMLPLGGGASVVSGAGALLLTTPVGWAILLGGAIIGGIGGLLLTKK